MSASTTNYWKIVILDALLRGHQDGNDILTLSLGGPDGWTASSTAIVASRIARTGKIVTIAAGNDVCRLLVRLFLELKVVVGRFRFLVYIKPRKRSWCHFGCQRWQVRSFLGFYCQLSLTVSTHISTAIPLQQATVHGVTHDPIIYYATLPLPVKDELPIYALSKDTTIANDACDPLPSDTPDLSPYLVIVRRGNCTFVSYNSTNTAINLTRT